MKKYLVFVLLFCLLFITGCDLINQMTCEHNLIVIEATESTCSTKGTIITRCDKCTYTKTEEKPLLPHDYGNQETISPDCNNDGYTLQTCKVCNYQEKTNIIPKLGHNYSNWEIITEATEFTDGLKQRTCERCQYIEKQVIISGEYIDLDIIKFDSFNNANYTANDYNELELFYNAGLLNGKTKIACNIKFEVSDFDALLSQLVNESRVPLSYQVSATLREERIEFSIVYGKFATASTSKVVYTQYESMNYIKCLSTRDSNYDDFKINKSKYSYSVSTTEQLVYVLQRQVKPICEKGSVAEKIYNEMKKVLIEIIDDNMSDVEKAKAIYEWLILNVTYDGELLQLVSKNKNVKEYNGFYLEGVFLDKKAVCEGIAKAFACLANIEGIPCVIVEGYQTNNPKGVGHAWNKININGNWYIIDATSGGIIVNEKFEILSYQYFLISENTMSLKYKSNNFVELVCNNDYDYYNNFNYVNINKTTDFLIESQEELNELVKYFENIDSKNQTIEFKVTFDFGKSISDEIQKAYSKLNITTQYSIIGGSNIFVLVK